jgi:hypothetical protein
MQTMDEVDFTILAATSVLGDLIEKCPPAEACRDAFDRMSKATVQMCMSTTGFGSSAGALNNNHRHRPHHHHHASPDEKNNDHFNNSKPLHRPNRAQPKSRPVPQFDMSLNDLLGPTSDTTQQLAKANFGPGATSSPGVKAEFEPYSTSATPSTRQNTNANTNRSPSDYAISPPMSGLDTSAIDPSLLPSPSATGTYAQQIQGTYAQNPYQEMQFDFLQDDGGGGGGWNGMGGAGGTGVDNNQWSGDMGMGLGWEVGDHDFSEGGNGGVDLFDGFFFGGTGNF